MKKIRGGKTKDIFEAGDGNILLLFKDDVTGTGDIIDPGANTVIGKVKGKGNASLKISKYFFEKLKDEGIPSHYIKADIEKNTMLVRKAETFGEGLEFICRLKAAGSFIRRYGKYAKENQVLDYLVEITLKDDDRGDPLLNDDSVVQLKLMTKEEVEEAKMLTKKITQLVQKECEDFGLELIDIKLEFGRIDGKIMVIDEISGDNMRVRKNGRSVMQNEFCEIIYK
ncbi:MAG TPA: phosphoribosylaminoimidazolesuccinocarboxamide synthase [Thermoanaerobacterales bacterium]|nr:phosphoribosylaminoimidazolesuccinocarboxamide synthase [Thermoanaerobacterales bacterium]